jgi:hypothetical protein
VLSSSSVLRLVLVLLLAACGKAPDQRTHTFEPGSQRVRGDRVEVELLAAQHEERHLILRIAVTNRAKTPIAIRREGLLLAYQRLEFPVVPDEYTSVPTSIAVPPGERVEVVLPFAPGTPVAARSILRVRSMQRDGASLDALSVPIPAPQGNGP